MVAGSFNCCVQISSCEHVHSQKLHFFFSMEYILIFMRTKNSSLWLWFFKQVLQVFFSWTPHSMFCFTTKTKWKIWIVRALQNPYTLHIHIQIYFIIHFAGNNQIFRKFSAVFSQTGIESRNVTQAEQQKYASVLHKLKLKNVLTQVLEYLISSISGQYLESVGCVLLIFSVFLLQLLNTTCCLYCWQMWLRVSKKPKETRFLLAPEPEMRGPWEIQVPVVHFSSSDQVILWRHLLPYFLCWLSAG